MKKRFIAVLLFLTPLVVAILAPISATANPIVPYQSFDQHGVKIAYRLFGTGAPLFLLNGGPGRSSETFTELAQKLSEITGRQVVLFDQRGTGKSVLPVLNLSSVNFDLMVEDIEGLRQHLGFKTISLMGHSFGGMYAMGYAARYPQFVSSLILSCSGGVDLKWQMYVQHNMLSRLTAEARAKYAFWTSDEQIEKDPVGSDREATKLLVPAYIYHQEFVPKLIDSLTNPQYSTFGLNPLVWESMKNYDVSHAFSQFNAAALIIDGRQDILGEELQIKIQRAIPNSRLEFLDECSHYPWLDAPQIYFRLIKNFLTQH